MTTGGAVAGTLDAVVLAAGAAARFGGGKLLAPWRGGLLIEAALDAAFAAPVRSVVLVTGADPGVMPTPATITFLMVFPGRFGALRRGRGRRLD